jgi:hypothetical protein
MDSEGIIVKHIKSKKGKYLGTLVGYSANRGTSVYTIGWSKFNSSAEDKLSLKTMKHKGYMIALGRAKECSFMGYSLEESHIPSSFREEVRLFVVRCARYFHTSSLPLNI